MKCLALIKRRQGRCYELAYRAMLYEPGAEQFSLFRAAQLPGAGEMIAPHAWVELDDDRVYDPVRDKYYTADEYAERYLAVAERRYSRVEAMRMAVHGRYGPWH